MSESPTPPPDPSTPAAPLAPLAYETPAPYVVAQDDYRWEGRILVTPLMANLPDFCVKCGQVGAVRHERKLTYLNPLFLLTILISWIILIILYLVFRRQGTVRFSLCEIHEALRRKWRAIAWTIGLLGLAGIVSAIAIMMNARGRVPDYALAVLIGGIVFSLAGLILGIVKVQQVKPKKIDRVAMWLSGISPEFGHAASSAPFAPPADGA